MNDDFLSDSILEDSILNSDPDAMRNQPIQPSKLYNRTDIMLNDQELQAREDASLQNASGVVRVSDSPSLERQDSDELLSTHSLHGTTLGVSKYQELREKVGLREGESFTDYYARTHGKVPYGYELEAKLLLKEEQRQKLFASYEQGTMSYHDFLFQAYGRDLLKADKHDLGSTLYWYNKFRNGDYSNPLENMAYVESVLHQAEMLFEAEEWWARSNALRTGDMAAAYVTGEVLSDDLVREIFQEQFELLDEYYESTEQIVKLHRAGFLQGFDPTVDINGDGKIDYYLHTDGKLYAIVDSAGEGASKAHAHYNNDGSLNRITISGSSVGEVSAATIKGFTGLFTGFADFGGMLAGGMIDLWDGMAGRGWNMDNAVSNSVAINAWLNQDTFAFGNSEYVVDAGLRTSDGDINSIRIARGVASAAGTITAMLATAGLGKIAKGMSLAGSAAMATAKAKGGVAAAKAMPKYLAIKGSAGLVKTASSLTGLSNGAPMSARYATVQSVSLLAVKDFMQSATSLSINRERLGMTDAEIVTQSFKMAALNASVSFAFRSVMDQSATIRWAKYAEGIKTKTQAANTLVANGQFHSGFTNAIKRWHNKMPRTMVNVNIGLDVFENMFTAYTQSSMSQTGEMFNKEAFNSFITNPQILAFNIWAGVASAKGGLGKMNEGMETGGISRHIGDLVRVDGEVRAAFKKRIADAKTAEGIKTWTKAYENYHSDTINSGDTYQGITTGLINLHNGLQRQDMSFVREIVTKSIGNSIRAEKLAEVQLAYHHYNAMVKATDTTAKNLFLGKVSSAIHFRRNGIIQKFDALLESAGGNIKDSIVKDMGDLTSRLVEANADLIEKDATLKAMEHFHIQGVQKLVEEKDGRYVLKNNIDTLKPEQLKRLKDAQFTVDEISEGYFINLKGMGSTTQGTEDFKAMQDVLRTFIRIAQSEADKVGTTRLIYSLDDSDTIAFIPSLGPNLNNITLATAGRAIQILYTLRYSSNPEEKVAVVKLFHSLFSNDNQTDLKDLKATEVVGLVNELTETGFLSIKEGASILRALESDHVTLNVNNKERLKTPMDLAEGTQMRKYLDGLDLINEIREITKKSVASRSDADIKKLRRVFTQFNENTDQDIKDKLMADGAIDPKLYKAISDIILTDPKTVQDLLKLLAEQVKSSSKSSSTDIIIRYIGDLLGFDSPITVPTPKERGDVLVGRTTSKPIQSLVSSETFTIREGEVRNVLTASRADLAQYFKESDPSISPALASRRANIAMKLLAEYQDNIITETTARFGDDAEAFYRRTYRDIGDDTNLSVDEIKVELYNSRHGINLLERVQSDYAERPLEDRMRKAVDYQNRFLEGSEIKAGDNRVYISIGELVGKRTLELSNKLQSSFYSKEVASAEGDIQRLKVLFGEDFSRAAKELVTEYMRLENLRLMYPSGRAVFSMDDAKDVSTLSNLFYYLNYNMAELRNNKKVQIPGVYYKSSGQEDAVLSFSVPKELHTKLLNDLKQGYGYNTVEYSAERSRTIDHTNALHSIFGGLTYLNDDTLINPKQIIFNDLSQANLKDASFEILDLISGIENTDIKKGKTAGNIIKVSLEGMNGVGLKTNKDAQLRAYDITITSIKALGDLTEGKEGTMAITRVTLSKSQADKFNRESPVWSLDKGQKRSDGQHDYQLFPKLKGEAFVKAAMEYFEKDNPNMRYILPTYGVDLDSENRNAAMGQFESNQVSIGFAPLTYLRSLFGNRYSLVEIFDTFNTEKFKHTYNLNLTEAEALNYFQNKKIGEIIATHNTLGQDVQDNIYYRMMYNMVTASKELSAVVDANLINKPDGLMSVVGSHEARSFVGQRFNEILNQGRMPTDQDFDDIARDLKLRMAGEIELTDPSDSNFYTQSRLSGGSTYLTGVEAKGLYGRNTIPVLRGAEIKLIFEMVKEHQSALNEAPNVKKAKSQTKILNLLTAAGAEKESKINLFLDSLYDLNTEDKTMLLRVLEGNISKKDLDLLKSKLDLLETESDIYRADPVPDVEGEKLAVGKTFERTISLIMDNAALIYKGDKDGQINNLTKVLNFVEGTFKHKKGEHEYKLSDIDSLEGQNLEFKTLKKLAELIGVDILPGVNREASIMIKNLELKDNLANFVTSNVRLADALQTIEIKGKRLSPEAAANLALTMYLKSSGMDYQNEWTKYLFVDMDTGKVINTAQRMIGDKELNNVLRQAGEYLGDLDNNNIILFDMDKNMMSDSTTAAGGRLKYIELNSSTKDKIVTAYVTNALAQWEASDYYRRNNPAIVNDIDKVAYVYANTPSIKDRKDYVIDALIKSGVDKRTAQAFFYNYYDLQSSKAENNRHMQIIFNTWNLIDDVKGNQRALQNDQMKRMNDILKYNTTYKAVPEVIKSAMIDKVRGQEKTYGRVVNSILFDTKVNSDLVLRQTMVDIQKRFNDIVEKSNDLSSRISKLATPEELDRQALDIIKESSDLYEEYALDLAVLRDYKDILTGSQVDQITTRLERIREIHVRNTEALDDIGQTHKDVVTLGKDLDRVAKQLARLGTTSVDDPKFKKAFLRGAVKNYLYSSKEAAAISLALTDNDIDYLLNFKDDSMPLNIRLNDSTTIDLREVLTKTIISYDVENFYNDKGEQAIFQIGIYIRKADGTQVKREIFVPVYDERGNIITEGRELAKRFGQFYADYKNEEGLMDAAKAYSAYFSKKNPIIMNVEGIINQVLKGETDYYSLGFNIKGHDNDLLIKQGLLKADSPLLDASRNIDLLNDVVSQLQSYVRLTNKRDLQTLLTSLGIRSEAAHDAGDDAQNTFLLLDRYVGRAADLNSIRQDGLDDISEIGRRIIGEDFKIEDYKDIFDENLKLDIASLPKDARDWVQSYRDNYKNHDNIYKKQEVVNRYNYLLLQQESEINRKKAAEFVRTLPSETVSLIYKMQDSSTKAEFKNLISYLASVNLTSANKRYKTFAAPSKFDLDYEDPEVDAEAKARRVSQIPNLINEEQSGVLDKVIDILHYTYPDEFKTLKNLSTILAKDPAEILEDISNSMQYRSLVSKEDYDAYKNDKGSNYKPLINVINNEFASSAEFEMIRKNEAIKTTTNLLTGRIDPVVDGLLSEIKDPVLKGFLATEMTKIYDSMHDGDLKNKDKIYRMDNKIREALFNYIKTHPIKRTTNKQLYTMIQEKQVGEKVRVNGKTEQVDSHTLYTNIKDFENLFDVSYEVAREYYSEDGDLFVPVIRHPNDKPQLIIMKVKISEDANTKAFMSPDTLAALLSGDVDGDGVAFLRPTKAMQQFAKDVLPITRSAFEAWDNVANALKGFNTTGIDLEADVSRLKFLQTAMLDLTMKNLEDLNRGTADFEKLKEDAITRLLALIVDKGYDIEVDDIEDLLGLVWINRGPNQTYFESEGTRRPYSSYALEAYKSGENVKAMQRMKESRTLLGESLTAVDQVTGSKQKQQVRSAEHQATFDKIANYAPFGLSAYSILRLKNLLKQDANNAAPVILPLLKATLTDSVNKNNHITKATKRTVINRIDMITDEHDFIYTLRSLEDHVRISKKSERIITKTIGDYSSNLKKEVEVNLDDQYMKALGALESTQRGIEGVDFIGSQLKASEMLENILGNEFRSLYFRDAQERQETVGFLIDHYRRHLPGKHTIQDKLESHKEPGFSNFQKRTVLYARNEHQLGGEDSMFKGPASKDMGYAFAKKVQLSYDENILVKIGDVLKTGDRISDTVRVHEDFDGYQVARVLNDNQLILVKNLEIDGNAKIGIAGTAMTKGTLIPGEFNSSGYKAGFLDDVSIIANIANFDITKIDSTVADQFTFKYYDASFNEIAEGDDAQFVKVEAPVAIASHTGTWKNQPKFSVVDEVTLGTSGRTLEGMGILGDNFIKYNQSTGRIEADSREIAALENIIKNMNQPDYVSHNAAPTYKMLLLTKLVQHDSSGRSAAAKEQYLKDTISNTKFAGVWGTAEVQKLLKNVNIPEFVASLNPMEKALFSDEVMSKVFTRSITKIPGVEEFATQTSKGSHYRVLTGLKGATLGDPLKNAGALDAMDRTDVGGSSMLDLTDTFISGLDLHNSILTAYNRTSETPIPHLTPANARRGTSLGLLNEGKAVQGNQGNNFNPIPSDYAVELGKTRNPTTGGHPKVGLTDTMIRKTENYLHNVKNIVPGEDYKNSIDLKRGENKYDIAKSKSKTIGKQGEERNVQVYRDRLAILLTGLLADSSSVVDTASKINPDYTNMAFYPNRLRLGLDQDTSAYKVTASPVVGHGNIPTGKFSEVMRESFSSRDFFTQAQEREGTLKDQISRFQDSPGFQKLDTDKSPDGPVGDLRPPEQISEAQRAWSEGRFAEEIFDATTNTFVRPRELTGTDEAMHHTYKTDPFSSSKIKADSKEAVRANIIAVGLKNEHAAIARDFYIQYRKVYMLASQYGVLDEVNEYGFIKGSFNRLTNIDAMLKKNPSEAERARLNDIKSQITKELKMDLEEAKTKLVKFESIYVNIVNEMGELNLMLGRTASHYAKISGELTADAFFLLTPNIIKTTGRERRNYVASMFLNNKADVDGSIKETKDGTYQESLPSFEGYHYFSGMDETIKQVSRRAAIVNGFTKLAEQGFLDNRKVEGIVNNRFNEYRHVFESIGKEDTYLRKEEVNHFESFISGVRSSFEEYDRSFASIKKRVGQRSITIGQGYLEVFDTLDEVIAKHGMSRAKAYEAMVSSKSPSTRQQAENIVKLYDFSNDIIAILATKQAQEASYKKTDATFLRALYKELRDADPNLVLVDRWGRPLDPDVNNFRMLSEGSTEYITQVLKYYTKYNGGFEQNVALDAMNGDVFYMNRGLSKILMDEFYVTKVPSNVRQHLKRAQAATVRLIMSNPFKVIDRATKFSAFDLALLTMANPATVTKIGKSRADLSAFLSSKGTVMSPELNEYLYARGLDPNRMNLNQILNGAPEYKKSGGVMGDYFNVMNKAFSYQSEFVRYAYWLSTKEKLQKGKSTVYGAAYYQKDHIDGIKEVKDLSGDTRVSKEGSQAAYIMGQNLGAPGDFPILAKKLNGYAAFTTFPLALVRWGRGEGQSMYAAVKNMAIEGERADAIKHLGVQGMGLLGIYLTSQFIYAVLGDMFNVPEEEREQWEKDQAIPRPIATLAQGNPVMDSFSSMNPVHELNKMGPKSFTEESSHGDSLGAQVWSFALRNVIGRVSPPIRATGEVVSGYDLLDDKLINTRDQYNMFENIFRKAAGYVMGMTGSNAMMRYMKSYEDHEEPFIERIGVGLTRAAQAELGNTRVYKSNIRNYYKANGIIQSYRFADEQERDFSGSTFDFDEYTKLRREIGTAMHNKLKYSDIYAIIEDALESGTGLSEIRSAVRNNSLRYKLETIPDLDAFFKTLTHAEKEVVKTALAYEDYMFPWLDELQNELDDKYSAASSYQQRRPRVYNNAYTPYMQRHYNPYGHRKIQFPSNRWQEPVIKETPLEAFKGEKDWSDRR